MAGPDTEVIHLPGRILIPVSVDPHNRFTLTTFQPVSVDCGAPTHVRINGLLDAISDDPMDAPPSRPVELGLGVQRQSDGGQPLASTSMDSQKVYSFWGLRWRLAG
jgi:hypothetical protein